MQQVYEEESPLCQLNISTKKKKKDVNPQLKKYPQKPCLCSF